MNLTGQQRRFACCCPAGYLPALGVTEEAGADLTQVCAEELLQ